MSDTATDAPAPKPKKKSGLLIKLVVGLIVIGAAGGGAAWWFLGSKAEARSTPPVEERGLVSFEPFLVNLADEGGNRFLKTNLELVVESAEAARHIQETPVLASHLRSAILELLTQQSASELVTTKGKDALKVSIKEQAAKVIGGDQVLDVLFSEFVVQF